MGKRWVSIVLVVFMLATGITANAQVLKDETVYVALNSDGSVSAIKVVNHIHGEGTEPYYTDYGNYEEIKNLSGDTIPEVVGNEIRWPMEMLKNGDLYYKGRIEKELPVHMKIRYFLDGKEMQAEEIGGKTGHLKIDIGIEFGTLDNGSTADLMAQIQIVADQRVFQNIKTEGSEVVVGGKSNITFVALPPTVQQFSLEMDGENIELEPIRMTLVPSEFSIPGNIEKDMEKLTNGLGELENASGELAGGASKVEKGMKSLKEGVQELNQGIGDLHGATSTLANESKKISSGMGQWHEGLSLAAEQSQGLIDGMDAMAGGLDELTQSSKEFNGGMRDLYTGVKELNRGMQGIQGGMQQLQAEHQKLVQLAKSLAQHEDPAVKAMVQGIIQEAEAIQTLSQGTAQTAGGLQKVEESVKVFHQGYGQYHEGMVRTTESAKQMAQEGKQLPQGLNKISGSFGALKEGINQLFGGYGEVQQALGLMDNKTKSLPSHIGQLIQGQNEIVQGMEQVKNDGMKKMRESLEQSLDQSFSRNEEGTPYTSFVNNGKNKNSTVQFVFQTPAIKAPEVEKQVEELKEEKKSFWQRILDLFR